MKLSLNDNFCSSPWFHIRVNPAGYYIPCRWAPEWNPTDNISNYNIANCSIADYMNSQVMQEFRLRNLAGERSEICSHCYYEDEHQKLSGRQFQLLKSAINSTNFNKTFCASPHFIDFNYSANNQGHTTRMPVDLQIDLGNTCNSACIMCNPTYSSKLATDYQKLHQMSDTVFPQYLPVTNWADNPELLDRFISELITIPNIKYLHFLGGETLYLKSFYKICNALIEAGLSKDIIIGTTTNGTIYSKELEDLIKQFKQVHLGISIETVSPLNDYISYPSDIKSVLSTIDKFLALRKDTNLYVSLRITPNIYSIYHIDQLFEFMITHSVTAESCNILSSPSCLRIELLPASIRNEIIDKIKTIIKQYDIAPSNVVVNRRRNDLIDPVISNTIYQYLNLLSTIEVVSGPDQERKNLITFTKSFEQLRNNCILDYLPEYEEFLRSYGY